MNPFSNHIINAVLFFKNLIKRDNKIECPRCLGKGFVNQDDIVRLKRELKWLPGSCAFCNGTGKVPADRTDQVPVDTTYLSVNLTAREQMKLFNGNAEAIERAKQFDAETDKIIDEIRKLHFENHLQVTDIAAYYFNKNPHAFNIDLQKREFTEYIKKVIAAGND